MSLLFSCSALAKAFGAQALFSGVELRVEESDRIGLIGPNGSGKSTLLKIICGLEDEDDGSIVRRRNLVTSYLAQEDRFDENRSPVDNLVSAMSSLPLDEAEKESRARTLLGRAMLAEPDQPVAELSGGWRKRVSICRSLAVEPDLLVLDEPTNHLDIEGIVWLEGLLTGTASYSGAFIVVSHDRRFLETCTNRIVELSRVYPSGSFQVDGTYSTFLERREEFLARQQRLEGRLRNKVRRETEWLRRGPKARSSKAKYRIDEAGRLQDELEQVSRQNRAEGSVTIDFEATGRKTKKLLEARDLGASVGGEQLFAGLDLVLSPGTRLGLVGRNGSGKSTLITILAGAVDRGSVPERGSIRVADGLALAVLTQDRSGLDPEMPLRRSLAPEGDAVLYRGRPLHVVSWAKRFLFRPDQLDTPVGRLSGGEQARILVADLMRRPADILLLDEPTNDLDINSLDVLEESLLEFSGAMVLVTHDRFLLDRVCNRVLGFTGDGRLVSYSDYRQWLSDLEPAEQRSAKEVSDGASRREPAAEVTRAARLTYLEQQEYEGIEADIVAAEEARDRFEQQLADPALAADPEALHHIWEDAERAKAEVERLYARWDELEDKKRNGERGR